ncbi:MAG: hypothetical protein RJA33_44 [Actinomycetota bacterium]|jgi:O-antigen ligase
MLHKTVEKTIALFLFIGVPITTLFISATLVTDPVNVTKLAVAGALGFGVFAIAIVYGAKNLWQTSKSLVLACFAVVLAMLNAVINSSTAFTQNIYGAFGRQTGFITYLVLTFVALSALLLRRKQSFEFLVWALLISGTVNILYCGYVLAFGDPIGWSNPYGNILGLFGNPNFIGAFLGMFISGAIAYMIGNFDKWWLPIVVIPLSLLAFYEILESNAIQGIVVTGAGLTLIGFYLVRSLLKHWIFQAIYVAFAAIGGTFALAGALQKGPLTSLIYKTSVSLRGTYWETGINMGQQFPLTGVGMDSYGNWYRILRPERALVDTPGISVITNAAHNVVIDFFAYGGYPLLLSYVSILIIGLIAIIKVTYRQRKFDGIFVSLTVTWLTYQLQSIISINQVGLAIWGWVLVGALVAYEFTTRPEKENSEAKKKVKQNELIFSPQLVGGVGLVIGFLIAFPPMSADMKWKSAVASKDVAKVEAALTPSYLTPRDSSRLAQAVILFENSKLPDQAYKYALEGVKFNPDYFDAWRVLYSASKASQADRDLALANMKRLDPNNPDVLAQ